MNKIKYYWLCILTYSVIWIPFIGIVIAYFINGTSIFPIKPIKPNKYYLEEVWIEGMYNPDYPPCLVLRRRLCGGFYKTVVDFGIIESLEDYKIKYKTATRYLHLFNIRHNYKNRQR